MRKMTVKYKRHREQNKGTLSGCDADVASVKEEGRQKSIA